MRRAQGLGGEVVDQPRGAETAVGAQPRLRQPPVGIGEVDGAVRHRPRHRQHHPLGPGAPGAGEIGFDRRLGRGVLGVHQGLFALEHGPAAVSVRQREARVGAPDVADEAPRWTHAKSTDAP